MFILFACAVVLSTAAVSSAGETAAVDCGGGYKRYGSGNCYKLSDIFVPWNEANAKCTEEGAYLAIIKNSSEAKVIHDIISDAANWAWTWIGLQDKDGNNEWRSVHGDRLDDIYHTWASSATLKNRCGTITHTKELEDMPCDTEKLAFVCEKAN